MDKVDDDQTNFDFVPHILAIQSLQAISLALELFLHEMKPTFVQTIQTLFYLPISSIRLQNLKLMRFVDNLHQRKVSNCQIFQANVNSYTLLLTLWCGRPEGIKRFATTTSINLVYEQPSVDGRRYFKVWRVQGSQEVLISTKRLLLLPKIQTDEKKVTNGN